LPFAAQPEATMRHLSLLLSALLFSAFVQASSHANITTVSCSGSQSFDLTNGAMLSCDGDFSLIGGSIDSDLGITISAFGSLFIDNLTLSAPIVQLKALTITVAEGASIDVSNWTNFNIGTSPALTLEQPGNLTLLERRTATVSTGGQISLSQPGQITLNQGGSIVVRQRGESSLSAGGQIVLNGGGSLTLVSSVPEPGRLWSMLSGGLLLLAIGRVRRKN
jgi:hypothetical protein